MSVHIVYDNLLTAPDPIIGQQCNCTSRNSAGLAKEIFRQHPWANTYINRPPLIHTPGTYTVHTGRVRQSVKSPERPLSIVNLYAQYWPGQPRQKDTFDDRLRWFGLALSRFFIETQAKTIALPFGIGCGLAGGSWARMNEQIEMIAGFYNREITLYSRARVPV